MQNRLFRRLGEWAMKNDADLRHDLQELGIEEQLQASDLAHARTLFARAIETPGGLKIQTIHSFCASLLRRFPMEAGVSPFFREIEDRSAKLLRAEVVEDLAAGPHMHVVEALARHFTGEDFDSLTAEIVRHREALMQPADAAADLGCFRPATRLFRQKFIAQTCFREMRRGCCNELIAALTSEVTRSPINARQRPFQALDRMARHWRILTFCPRFFSLVPGAKEPYSAKIGSFPTKDLRESHCLTSSSSSIPSCSASRSLDRCCNRMRSAERTLALYDFAGLFPARVCRTQATARLAGFRRSDRRCPRAC